MLKNLDNITRRRFFAESAVCTAVTTSAVSASINSSDVLKLDKIEKENSPLKEADVVVIGGGTAGVIAAIQAAKMGAKNYAH